MASEKILEGKKKIVKEIEDKVKNNLIDVNNEL